MRYAAPNVTSLSDFRQEKEQQLDRDFAAIIALLSGHSSLTSCLDLDQITEEMNQILVQKSGGNGSSPEETFELLPFTGHKSETDK